MSRPRLFGRLAAPARVIVVSAPAGSGKTVLLRSWISESGLAGRAAWVPAGRGERDPQQFWLSVTGALRRTGPGSVLVRPLTAAPDLDGGAIAERLLADLLTGDQGGERVLQDLEAANAFVVSLDPARSWFRYHQMFAGLLQLELRRTAPGAVAGLHAAAAGWLAAHGHPVEAVRHAQAAGDWTLAGHLLADHWTGLYLDGQTATVHELLAGFPAGLAATDAGLAALAAADELAHGSLQAAERYLTLAGRHSEIGTRADRRAIRTASPRGGAAAAGPPAWEPAGRDRRRAGTAGHGRGRGRGAARPRGGP